jgi:Dna[CI] antecedent DciA-like protein
MRGSFMSRDFEHVRAGLEKVMGSSLRHISPGERPVLAWPLACGSKVAARTRALEFTGGVLRVEVPDAGWRAELQALSPQYLAVINRYTVEAVKRVEFVVATARGGAARATE